MSDKAHRFPCRSSNNRQSAKKNAKHAEKLIGNTAAPNSVLNLAAVSAERILAFFALGGYLIGSTVTGVCAFCGGKITSGEFDWVLSRIEHNESYAC
jgi:hypothetical protein